MGTFTLGQVAPVNKGAYSRNTGYAVLNMVSHNGGTWMCIAPTTGVEPGVTPGWETKWMSAALGISEVSFSSPSPGTAKMVVSFSGGTTKEFTFNTATISPGSISASLIANNAITEEKLNPTLVESMDRKYAPAYSFGTMDKVPGSYSSEPEGTIYWVVDTV